MVAWFVGPDCVLRALVVDVVPVAPRIRRPVVLADIVAAVVADSLVVEQGCV